MTSIPNTVARKQSLMICRTRLEEAQRAVEDQIASYTAENQRHVYIKGVSEVVLKSHIESVRTTGVALAGNVDPLIAEKLAVLKSAGTYVSRLGDGTTVECPACGQAVPVETFREHVKEEEERLQGIKGTYEAYKAAIGAVCDSLNSLKSSLARPELSSWQKRTWGPCHHRRP